MKEHILKLMPGEDLVLSLQYYCVQKEIEAAYLATCVGSFESISFRKGYTRELIGLGGIFEIVSITGTLSKGGSHIHGSFSDEQFHLLGGHLVKGCIVKTTAEVVIIELEGHQLTRSKDNLTGYKSLKIVASINSCDEYE